MTAGFIDFIHEVSKSIGWSLHQLAPAGIHGPANMVAAQGVVIRNDGDVCRAWRESVV